LVGKAGPLSVIVQFPIEFAVTREGLQTIEERLGGTKSDSVAVAVAEPSVAVIVALPLVLMLPAIAMNVLVVELAAMVTAAGTVRDALFDERATVVAVEVALDRVTVQVEVALEASVVGVH
jgi:hypothetical protein